jgi:hypothetical protein
VFYSGTGTSAEARSATVIARDEKELERKLKAEVDRLEAALQP